MRSAIIAFRSIVVQTVSLFVLTLSVATVPSNGAEESDKQPTKSNELCYVCHLDMITEKITNIHIEHDIACTDCHGDSRHHMHDEMLMTKPDSLFGRSEVDGLCRHCHHHDPHADKQEKIDAFIKEWQGKDRPNGRSVNSESICTDCHGTHNIVKQMKGKASDEKGDWTALFNGEDLSGWTKEGGADWRIQRGRIVAVPKSGKGGTLWADRQYTDFLASITFKVDGAVDAALCLRGGEKGAAAKVRITGPAKRGFLTGGVSVPGTGTVLANVDKDLISEMMWNTISVKMQGKRLTVWLNGEEIGSVRLTGAETGRLGLAVADSDSAGTLTINELQVQVLK
jgi:hypothetical protein